MFCPNIFVAGKGLSSICKEEIFISVMITPTLFFSFLASLPLNWGRANEWFPGFRFADLSHTKHMTQDAKPTSVAGPSELVLTFA